MNNPDVKTIDVRGTACPMNYVKVLVALEDMDVGERLNVILDDEKGLVDVPRSAKEDGHKILKVEPFNKAYRITIEKGAYQR